MLTLRTPAKINLTLRIGQRRPDGFHDVETVLQSIGLSDTLTFRPTAGPFRVTTSGRDVPADRSNLIWRAAMALWSAAGRDGEPHGARVTLRKLIPVAAGLGGGSANAAGALVGLNRTWALGVSRVDLLRLAATLGSDVPFFLTGGTAVGLGRGDRILPLRPIRRLGVVVIKPAFGVSTADAYRWLDEDRGRGIVDCDESPSGFNVGWPSPLILVNDLEAPVARRHSGIVQAVRAALEAGALAAAMTGSGSAVFGLFAPASAPAAARRLRRSGWVVHATTTLSAGESGRLMSL
ncbi:MAG TPA: 4-(cytidine 5'-diphospho)-2-C-methyl-D-erythritol kinase [Vicinamibacterales bacterium]|nr:4-(cytidine 5'-diphospho)-2-C-methyl-D-erythritol kinase [Vicinamibacterales bacterium]